MGQKNDRVPHISLVFCEMWEVIPFRTKGSGRHRSFKLAFHRPHANKIVIPTEAEGPAVCRVPPRPKQKAHSLLPTLK
jgi:hypothetical protein